MTDQNDKIFKEWADGYVEQYGQSLLEEKRMLDEQGIRYLTPRADAQAQQLARGRKKRNKVPLLAAAALLLAFVGASAVLLNSPLLNPPASSQSGVVQGPDANTTDNIHPLDFALPAHFSVANVEWDNGETVYHLDNSLSDDAILTIRDSEGSTDWMRDLDEVYIDGAPIPAKLRDEYKLLTFENEGRLYAISCRDDLGTLSGLYHSITENKKS